MELYIQHGVDIAELFITYTKVEVNSKCPADKPTIFHFIDV